MKVLVDVDDYVVNSIINALSELGVKEVSPEKVAEIIAEDILMRYANMDYINLEEIKRAL